MKRTTNHNCVPNIRQNTPIGKILQVATSADLSLWSLSGENLSLAYIVSHPNLSFFGCLFPFLICLCLFIFFLAYMSFQEFQSQQIWRAPGWKTGILLGYRQPSESKSEGKAFCVLTQNHLLLVGAAQRWDDEVPFLREESVEHGPAAKVPMLWSRTPERCMASSLV